MELRFDGGWYCDCLPSGEWAVYFPAGDLHIDTHAGRVELPGEGVLYLRVGTYRLWDGRDVFAMCGQGWSSGKAWLWAAGVWSDQGPAHGVSPCIFSNGRLLVQRWEGEGTSSQGYRYVTDAGQVVTGDASMYSPALGVHEYTTFGDVTIGQGHEGGCLAVLPTPHLVEPGDTRFIRFTRVADLCAIALVKPGVAVLRWASVQDLAALPGPPVATVPAVNRPVWVGWFEFATPPTAPPGNCLLATSDAIVRRGDLQIAQYFAVEVEGNTPEAYAAGHAKARAAHPLLPTIAYWPRGAQLGPIPACDWVGVEAYQRTDETLDFFERRLRIAINRCHFVALIAQCYTSNTTLTTDLVSLVPVYARLAASCSNIVAILAFSDHGRATGLTNHPEARASWQQLAASVTVPSVVLIPPPPDEHQEPPHMDKGPSVGQWINEELPKIVEAWRYGQQQPPDAVPSFDWAAFMAWRRFSGWVPGSGESWSLQRLIDNERAQHPAGGGSSDPQ